MKYAAFLIGMILPLMAPGQETLLGAALRSRPAYDGSATQRADIVPVILYYGRPWFARTTQGVLEAGARTELAPGFHAGAQLAYEPGPDNPELNAGVSRAHRAQVELLRKRGTRLPLLAVAEGASALSRFS